MTAQFTDSCAGNLELIKELLAGLPGTARPRARRAGSAIMDVWDKLKKEYPKDPAVALGAAMAVFYIAETLINAQDGGDKSEGDRLIITLNG